MWFFLQTLSENMTNTRSLEVVLSVVVILFSYSCSDAEVRKNHRIFQMALSMKAVSVYGSEFQKPGRSIEGKVERFQIRPTAKAA